MYIFIILFLVSDILIVDQFDSHNHLSKLFFLVQHLYVNVFILCCFMVSVSNVFPYIHLSLGFFM